jgi:cytoskeletal protein RodZ
MQEIICKNPPLQLEQQTTGGFMKTYVRHRISLFVLATLFLGTLAPCALYAQSTPTTQDQSSASSSATTTTKSKRKKKNADNSSSSSTSASTTPAATTQPAAAPSAPAASSTSSTAASTTASHSSKSSSTVQAQTPPSPGMVWVNTNSGVYHKSGSKWYGKTKEGKWMTEQDATKAGYKAAKN